MPKNREFSCSSLGDRRWTPGPVFHSYLQTMTGQPVVTQLLVAASTDGSGVSRQWQLTVDDNAAAVSWTLRHDERTCSWVMSSLATCWLDPSHITWVWSFKSKPTGLSQASTSVKHVAKRSTAEAASEVGRHRNGLWQIEWSRDLWRCI